MNIINPTPPDPAHGALSKHSGAVEEDGHINRANAALGMSIGMLAGAVLGIAVLPGLGVAVFPTVGAVIGTVIGNYAVRITNRRHAMR